MKKPREFGPPYGGTARAAFSISVVLHRYARSGEVERRRAGMYA
jgi:hypothetical protein